MSPLVPMTVKREGHMIKRGTVGKITTEVRKKVPDPKTIKNNYYVNRAKQVNKIVIKNKIGAPLNIETHSNDVYINYSPAVFKEAVVPITDLMKEGMLFETDKVKIKVTKVMPSTDLNMIKTQDLITMEVQSKNNTEKPVKLQLHVYFTNQAVMIQGHRRVGGVKGFKLFVESFFQPYVEHLIQTNKEQIDQTKNMLDKSGDQKVPDEVKELKQVEEQNTATEVAKEMINEMLNEASIKKVKSTGFNCPRCEGVFMDETKLKEHVYRVHKESKLMCDVCKIDFKSDKEVDSHMEKKNCKSVTFACKLCQINVESYQEMSIHIEEKHGVSETFSCDICNVNCQSYQEVKVHIEKCHSESVIQTEANNVIKSIIEKICKIVRKRRRRV